MNEQLTALYLSKEEELFNALQNIIDIYDELGDALVALRAWDEEQGAHLHNAIEQGRRALEMDGSNYPNFDDDEEDEDCN